MRPAFRVLVIIVLPLACTALAWWQGWEHGGAAALRADAGWQAPPPALAQRVERLAAAGEIEAARGVLDVLATRDAPAFAARARLALSDALVASGKGDAAQEVVRAVPWADKGPEIAARLVGIELAAGWQRLLVDGEPASGLLPPRLVPDSDAGNRGGAWAARRDGFAAFVAALDRGARMARAEGATVRLPADEGMIALARYAHGALDAAGLERALGAPAARSPGWRWRPAGCTSLNMTSKRRSPSSTWVTACPPMAACTVALMSSERIP